MDDELYYDAIDLLERLIATPRTSRNEDAAATIVADFMSSAGLSPRRHHNNVWVTDPCHDPSRPTVLLNSHIDTVKPVDGWTRDPFAPVTDPETGRLYGLGSNDAGASLVSLIAAFRALIGRERRYNLVMLASAEEEVSGRDGIESVIPMMPPIDVAIVGEPTGMHPAIAEKGLVVLDGVVEGVAGHAARPGEGVNAIYRTLPVVETLRDMTFERESAMLGPVRVSVTQIEAGTQHNVVPDRCSIVVDVRTTDAYTNAETVDIIRRAVPSCCLTPRSTRLEPSSIAPDHPLVERAVTMGLEPFGSPTLSDQALMPWPSLKMGPGSSSRSHHADEWIHPDEIREAIAIYTRLLG